MRIVSGKHRGLVLYEFDAENIRPTIDRVRENIFNKIQFGIYNCKVLDLFGGTGAVSIEFLSRGAKEVFVIDNNKNSIEIIEKNFAKAKEKLNLIKKDFRDGIKDLVNKKFDYIFIDPPYKENFGEESLQLISNYKILDSDGLIIYEHLVDKEFNIPNTMEIVDYKKYGTVAITYIRWKDESN